jgi:amino acid adenylation domain-containing protein/non-ribosomal peptide synthase protein (TIGR01720 family)
MLNFPEGIEAVVVMAIFKKLQDHHDALRMVYLREGDEMVQENKETGIPVLLSVHDLTKEIDADTAAIAIQSAAAAIQSGIDLANGPLLKLGLFRMNDGCRLLIAIHHLVIDGVSWRILFEDIETLYRQIVQQQPLVLPLKTHSYRVWAESLLQYVNSNAHKHALPYWQDLTQRSLMPIARDHADGRNTFGDTQSISFQLSKETTALLLTQAHVSFNTQINDILLAALLLSIHRQYGNDALMIDMETHGREAISLQVNVNRTIGWFTSFYPVLLEKIDGSTAAVIRHIKETLRRVPNNGIDYLVQQYLAEGSLLKDPHAQVSFNYLGQFDADISGNVFTMARESAGSDIAPATARDYDWDVSGIITGAQLTMRLTYSTQQYNDATITSLMDVYKKSLLELIDYCCNYGKIELSPSDLTYKELSIAKLNELQQKYDLEDIYPLSPMQENMLFHSLMDLDSNHYFQQMSYIVEGRLDVKAIEKTMNDLIARYDVLRTLFVHDGHERPVQIVLKERKIDCLYKDVREECLQCQEEAVMLSYRSADMARTFDLRKDVLMRLTILQVSQQKFLFIWSHHHIIMDGWCMSIIVSEFSRLYAANMKAAIITLPAVVPYSKYIKWVEESDKQASTRYWSNYLDGYETLATLPKKEIAAIEKIPYSLAWEEFSIGKEQSKKMQKFSAEQGVTLNTLLQAAWGILLAKYNNVNDVVFGSVVSGRPTEIEGIETMVGLFINTIPVRVRYSPQDTVASLLQQVQQSTVESEQYQYQPLPEIQLLNQLGRGLLDHIIVFEDYPGADKLNGEGQDYTVTGIELFEQANYDLMFIVIPGNEIRIKIDYNAHRYNKSTIQAITAHITNILDQLIADGFATLAGIEMITSQEKDMILHNFNDSAADYPASKTFIDLFEEQVASMPGAIAAIYNNQRLTYEALNEKANQLASYLEHYAQRGTCIPVLMEPSIDLLVCMLGIFKAGLVYVPINTDAPLARIIDNIAGLDAQMLITKSEYLADAVAFYDTLTKETRVSHIILCDVEQPSAEAADLFKTYSVAAKVSGDPLHVLPASMNLYDGNQHLAGEALNERIAQLCSLLRGVSASGQPAIFLSSPLLRIIAIQSLRQLGLSFRELTADELNTASLEGISVLLTENAHNDKTDTLFWESADVQNIILLDRYGSFSKKEDAFKKIWNHVSEETTEAINDYGWSSSYTAKSFSIEEMEEYISNFKTKLRPHLTTGSRVLEVGCGHGILLFELAPQVGYYHATDLAENILRKNKERLLRKSIYNAALEVCAASGIAGITEKDFDVVVCSSVVHYFPDTIYLERFILDSIELMKEEGILYLDDLMDLRQKENLIQSTRSYKREHPEAKVKTEWDNDLFVGPGFFEFLRSNHPEIVAVDITSKTGVIENELTKFRYDVMLKINKRTARMPKKKQNIKKRYLFEDLVRQPVTAMHISSPSIELDNYGIITGRAALAGYDVRNRQYRSAPADTCYIIYTSGTTGRPKGAMVHHAGMLNHLFAKINELSVTDKDVIAETAPASFDISIWQFLAALLKGAHTYIIDREKVLEPSVLLKELQQGSVTVFESIPSLIITILDGLQKSHDGLLNKLRWMIPTGEPLSVALTRKWYSYFPGIKLLNAYGPTEASDDVTHHIVEPPAEDQLTISIGRPVQNMHIYILDKYMNLCPPGVKGEICVAGVGVGKGYWKDAEKTSKSFVPNPYKKENDPTYDTIYKTGDVGYYQENGNIICLGRIDNQVKIRAFRIELGEIEHWLSQYKEIQESVVIARNREGDKFLVVYYVAEQDISQAALKAFLAQKLADYMVPAYYVRLKNIPVTSNGKLDRKALPDPTLKAGEEYEAPSNETEEKLAEIWSEVLRTDKSAISINSSFFELGGHSLKATLMVNKIQKQFEVEIPLKEVFQKQSIQSLADYITTIRQMKNSIEDINEMIEIAI